MTVDFDARVRRRSPRQQLLVAADGSQRRSMPAAHHHRHHPQPRLHASMGLGISVEAHRSLSVFLRVDNLADRGMGQRRLGYPGLPRAAVVGARFNVSAR